MLMALMPAGKIQPVSALSWRALPGVPRGPPGGAPRSIPSLLRPSDANVFNRESKRLIKANHSKGWDAKPLAYVPRARDTVAGLPGEHSTS
jgi:hypothetical protein